MIGPARALALALAIAGAAVTPVAGAEPVPGHGPEVLDALRAWRDYQKRRGRGAVAEATAPARSAPAIAPVPAPKPIVLIVTDELCADAVAFSDAYPQLRPLDSGEMGLLALAWRAADACAEQRPGR